MIYIYELGYEYMVLKYEEAYYEIKCKKYIKR